MQNRILITQNAFCPTATGDTPIRMEWNMHIRATDAYARLSVVVIQGLC